MVLKYLNERAGIMNCFDESIVKQYETQESNRENCPLCKSTFNRRYMLLHHLCDCHFRERLCQVLPPIAGVTSETTYRCPHPQCTHESKDKGGFARHYGLVHKVVQGWLKEMGITGFDDGEKKQKIEFTGPNSGATNSQQQQEKQHLQPPSSGLQQYQHQYAEPQSQPQPQQPAPPQPQPPPAVQVPIQQPQPDYSGQQQYYSSPPPTAAASGSSSFNSQFSPPQQPQSAARSYSNHLTSPSSQASPQNLSNDYISPQNTPYQQYDYYNNAQQQPTPVPENTQPLDYSSNGYFNQPQQPQMRVGYGQQQASGAPPPTQAQPLTPQTPNPPTTPQTPQPMTPSSHEAVTPQPMTPQDQQLLSPGGYNYQPVQQQQQYPAQYASRPVTLQPQDPAPSSVAQPQVPKPVNNKANHGGPPSDEYIEAPASGLIGPFAIQCLYCNNTSKNKSDFYRHLSERHFKAQLAKELPAKAPYKCPIQGCQYESKDNSVSPLIKHYGIGK